MFSYLIFRENLLPYQVLLRKVKRMAQLISLARLHQGYSRSERERSGRDKQNSYRRDRLSLFM